MNSPELTKKIYESQQLALQGDAWAFVNTLQILARAAHSNEACAEEDAKDASEFRQQLQSSDIATHIACCQAIAAFMNDPTHAANYVRQFPEEKEIYPQQQQALNNYIRLVSDYHIVFHLNRATAAFVSSSASIAGSLVGSVIGFYGLTLATSSLLFFASAGIGAAAGLAVGLLIVLAIRHAREQRKTSIMSLANNPATLFSSNIANIVSSSAQSLLAVEATAIAAHHTNKEC